MIILKILAFIIGGFFAVAFAVILVCLIIELLFALAVFIMPIKDVNQYREWLKERYGKNKETDRN